MKPTSVVRAKNSLRVEIQRVQWRRLPHKRSNKPMKKEIIKNLTTKILRRASRNRTQKAVTTRKAKKQTKPTLCLILLLQLISRKQRQELWTVQTYPLLLPIANLSATNNALVEEDEHEPESVSESVVNG